MSRSATEQAQYDILVNGHVDALFTVGEGVEEVCFRREALINFLHTTINAAMTIHLDYTKHKTAEMFAEWRATGQNYT